MLIKSAVSQTGSHKQPYKRIKYIKNYINNKVRDRME